MSRYALILFVLFYSLRAGAQNDSLIWGESPIKKNTFYVNLGGNLSFYFQGSLMYEYLFWQRKRAVHIAIGGQVGYSLYAVWGEGGSIVNVNLVLLTGGKNSHFEFTGGTNIFLQGDLKGYGAYVLSTSAGFRFQKPIGGFVFRFGMGWPELGYIGLGVNF